MQKETEEETWAETVKMEFLKETEFMEETGNSILGTRSNNI